MNPLRLRIHRIIDCLFDMINDLSKYRLNDESELDRYMKENPSRLVEFMAKVYNMLDRIEVGESVVVLDICRPESLDVFIKCVCKYILIHQGDGMEHSFIEFSEDYRRIYRRPGIPEFKHLPKTFYSDR